MRRGRANGSLNLQEESLIAVLRDIARVTGAIVSGAATGAARAIPAQASAQVDSGQTGVGNNGLVTQRSRAVMH